MESTSLQNGILYTVGVAAVDNSGNASPIQSGFVQVPKATGKSGCSCHLAGVDHGAVPWGSPTTPTLTFSLHELPQTLIKCLAPLWRSRPVPGSAASGDAISPQ